LYYSDKILLFNAKYNYRKFNDGIGSTRIISKKILDYIDWDLYKFNIPINKSLDGKSFNKIKDFIKNIKFDICDGYGLITLKNPSDDTAITIRENVFDFIKKYYRKNKNYVINNVIILDYMINNK
jgi:hypothetical protein